MKNSTLLLKIALVWKIKQNFRRLHQYVCIGMSALQKPKSFSGWNFRVKVSDPYACTSKGEKHQVRQLEPSGIIWAQLVQPDTRWKAWSSHCCVWGVITLQSPAFFPYHKETASNPPRFMIPYIHKYPVLNSHLLFRGPPVSNLWEHNIWNDFVTFCCTQGYEYEMIPVRRARQVEQSLSFCAVVSEMRCIYPSYQFICLSFLPPRSCHEKRASCTKATKICVEHFWFVSSNLPRTKPFRLDRVNPTEFKTHNFPDHQNFFVQPVCANLSYLISHRKKFVGILLSPICNHSRPAILVLTS